MVEDFLQLLGIQKPDTKLMVVQVVVLLFCPWSVKILSLVSKNIVILVAVISTPASVARGNVSLMLFCCILSWCVQAFLLIQAFVLLFLLIQCQSHFCCFIVWPKVMKFEELSRKDLEYYHPYQTSCVVNKKLEF